MQTSTAIKALDLNFNSVSAGGEEGEGEGGSGPWASATAAADFPSGGKSADKSANDQSSSKNLDLFISALIGEFIRSK